MSSNRKTIAPGSTDAYPVLAAARYRRVPAHDCAVVRGPGEIHSRARGGHEGGQADLARHAEERRRRRSGDRRDIRHRNVGEGSATAQAARRHREGAGRRRSCARRIKALLPTEGYYEAEAEAIADDPIDPIEAEALSRSVLSEFENYVKLNKKISPEVVAAVTQIDDYGKLADTIASHLAVKLADKQAILEIHSTA